MPQTRPALLLTRPRAQAERFAGACKDRLGDIDVVISPILSITPRAEAVDLTGLAGVILSSENGARVLAGLADIHRVTAWCVGDRTAAAARELGFAARSAGGDAGDLVRLMLRERPGGRLLHAHGAKTRGDIAGRLCAAGLTVETAAIYDQAATALSPAAGALLEGSGPVVLPLFSPRSARLVGDAATGSTAPLAVVALSPAVAKNWTGPGPASFTVAEHPDAANMLHSIATIWTSLLA
ncbi:MAG: uroporphyrinogen-III synthase [Rhodobacteraceae bacterium]|nr:uroporphyrinogen-III synthase [Paracoccaceae bacterium]